MKFILYGFRLWNFDIILQSMSYESFFEKSQYDSNMTHNIYNIGETQILFRDLPKFLIFGKTLRPSCWVSKIIASHKILLHDHVTESRNSINKFEVWEWEKYPLKWFFSKTVRVIVIIVPRSRPSPKIMKKDLQILVFSASWSSAFFEIGDHELL